MTNNGSNTNQDKLNKLAADNSIPSEIKNLIFEKEKLIFELFYPEILKDNY